MTQVHPVKVIPDIITGVKDDGLFEKVVVMDNGSFMCKAGYSGDPKPRVMFPSVVGRPKYKNAMGSSAGIFIGIEALAKRGVLSLKYPIQNGIGSCSLRHVTRHEEQDDVR